MDLAGVEALQVGTTVLVEASPASPSRNLLPRRVVSDTASPLSKGACEGEPEVGEAKPPTTLLMWISLLLAWLVIDFSLSVSTTKVVMAG